MSLKAIAHKTQQRLQSHDLRISLQPLGELSWMSVITLSGYSLCQKKPTTYSELGFHDPPGKGGLTNNWLGQFLALLVLGDPPKLWINGGFLWTKTVHKKSHPRACPFKLCWLLTAQLLKYISKNDISLGGAQRHERRSHKPRRTDGCYQMYYLSLQRHTSFCTLTVTYQDGLKLQSSWMTLLKQTILAIFSRGCMAAESNDFSQTLFQALSVRDERFPQRRTYNKNLFCFPCTQVINGRPLNQLHKLLQIHYMFARTGNQKGRKFSDIHVMSLYWTNLSLRLSWIVRIYFCS